MLQVNAPPPPDMRQPVRSANEIPRELLPDRFEELSWEKQTSHCEAIA